MSKMDEYRGSNHWKGLIPAKHGPDRIWDDGFRSFLIKYGMLNHVVYDVFIKGEDNAKDEQGLRGTSRFKDDLESFTKHGLEFSYVKKAGARLTEYDFSEEYDVVENLVSSPDSVFGTEDNWFGFIALSKDKTEMVAVFRGTETNAEWIENATMNLEQFDGQSKLPCLNRWFDRRNLMCHAGFQQLYTKSAANGQLSPKDSVRKVATANMDTITKITLVGHSLGGAMAQMCAVDLAFSGLFGDTPILGIGWAAPKIGNRGLADWVKEQPNLRIVRVQNPNDVVTQVPPDWMWNVSAGGYKHVGTEVTLSNTFLHNQKLVKAKDGNSPNHNLEMYLHNVDPSRDIALMNKIGDVLPEALCAKESISPSWHSRTFPRTIYHK